MQQLPDLFPTEGIVDPQPVSPVTPDLPDLYPPGMEPLRPDARVKQARLLKPDTAVRDIQLSRDTGLDPELISRNRDDILLKTDVEKMNAGLVGAPGLRAYIHQSPHKMAAVADDVDTLAEIERVVQKGIGTVETAGKSLLRFGPTIGQFTYDTLGLLAGTLDSAAQGLGDLTGTEAGGLFGNVRDFALSSSKEIQDYKDEYLGLPEELRGRLIDNPQYLVDPQWLIQNVGDAAASLAPVIMSATLSGSNLLGGLVGGLMEGASQYRDLIEEGVDPDSAALASQAMVPVVAVLNKLGLDAILSKRLASTWLQRAGKALVASGTEGLSEYAEEPFGALFSSLARGDDYDTTVQNIWQSFENIEALFVGGILGGGVNVMHTAREQVIAQRADQEQQVLDALTQNIMQTKLGQLDPQLLEEVVGMVKKGGQIENVYVPASAMASNFESDLQGMSETLNQLGVSMEQFDAALATGNDLVIPVEKYAAAVAANQEFAARFANDRRLTADGLTRNEAVQAQQDFQAETARLVQMLKEDRESANEYETQIKTIQEEVLTMRQETGLVTDAMRADARMTAATFGVLARMNNVTPAELWQAYGPQVTRGGQDVVDQQSLQQDAAFAGVETEAEIEEARRLWTEMGTESPYFKRWSGGAPVVPRGQDHDFQTGQAVVVEGMHGGRRELAGGVFKLGPDGAVFFTSNEHVAKVHKIGMQSGGIHEAFIRMSNPYVVDYRGSDITRNNAEEAVREAQANGHDGVIIKNFIDIPENRLEVAQRLGTEQGYRGTVYAALDPTQIKSVNNRGTFDPADARIQYQDNPAAIAADAAAQVAPGAEQGVVRDVETGETVFNVEEAAKGLASGMTFYQGISEPVGGRFMRGTAKTGEQAADVVTQALLESGLELRTFDQFGSIEEAKAWADNVQWLDPILDRRKKSLRHNRPNELGWYGNEKMAFPNAAYPRGRNTWDIAGCGRAAWAIYNDQEIKNACYGGACYAEAIKIAKQGKSAGVTKGVDKKAVAKRIERGALFKIMHEQGLDALIEEANKQDVEVGRVVATKADREFVKALYEQGGNEAVWKEKPNFIVENGSVFKVTLGRFFTASGRLLTLDELATFAGSPAVVSAKLAPAKGQDIRLGVDTDGAAWLSRPEVMDALLAAGPRSLTIYSSAYHKPPQPHPLSGRTIINVTISGWHPLGETLSRLRWAEEARANGWNVILREVVADPEAFGQDMADVYNRVHDAILKTDFFVMQQPLHIGSKTGKEMWGLPGCCKGSPNNPGTCDQCEVAEGLGKRFQEYWDIAEENRREEKILPDVEDYRGRQLFQQQSPLGFVSAVETAIDGMDFKTMPGKDLANRVKKTGGIKAEELEDLGLIEWLDGLGAEKVSKDQVLEFVHNEGPQIEEVVKGKVKRVTDKERAIYDELSSRGWDSLTEEERAVHDDLWQRLASPGRNNTKFSQYTMPGGKNYREVMLTLPPVERTQYFLAYKGGPTLGDGYGSEAEAMAEMQSEFPGRDDIEVRAGDGTRSMTTKNSNNFIVPSAHRYGDNADVNRLAHFRLNDRTGPNGEKILFIEEIQSDWHQEGRKKGYRGDQEKRFNDLIQKRDALPEGQERGTIQAEINRMGVSDPGVPNAPFKKSWNMLAMKRILRMAAEQGYDSVAWTPGEVQAERYNLAKHVSVIQFEKSTTGEGYAVIARDLRGTEIDVPNVDKYHYSESQIEATFGKDIAGQIVEKGEGTIQGEGLKVGGEGMKGFYDKILPAEVNKYVKKWGVKVGTTSVPVSGGKPTDYADFNDYMAKKDGASQQVWALPITDQMRQDILQGQPLYQNQGEPQAAFTFKTASGKPLIELFQTANQSSFLHETGHLYLEMIRDLAIKADAPQAMQDLWLQAKTALKIDDGPISREAHEEWARNLEAYFAKGEAPSLGMRGLFAKYAEWLKTIYREVENIFAASGTQFNPDLKPIFDRLFATEQETREAEAFYAAQRPFFDLADQMSDEDRAAIQKLRDKAQETSFDSRLRKLTEAYVKAQGGRKALTDELRPEVEGRRVYTAIEAARAGGFELAEIDGLVGEDTRKAISKKWKLVKVGGDLDPNVVAAQNGYDSAREMLMEMAQVPSKQQALKEAVDERVEAERQTILRGLMDQDAVIAADEAYHNEDRLALLVSEFTILAEQSSRRQGARARALDAAAALEVAKQTLRSMPLRDAVKYQKFARAEREAAIRSREAKRAGKTADALQTKRTELLNHALFMESMKLRGQIQKLEKAIKKGAKQKSMLPAAKDLLQGLGIQYGLMPYVKLKKDQAWTAYTQSFAAKGEERPTLSDWAAERENEFGVYFDPFVLQNAGYVPLQDLTVEQFDAVRQAVNTIRTVDRNERTVLVNGERIALEEAEDRLEQSILGRKLTSTQRSKRKSKLRKMISGTHAFHAKMEAMILDLDNWGYGHWWNMFFKPIADAENARSERLKDVHDEIQKIFKPVKKGLGKRVFIPEINDSLQKAEIMAIALNMGNEGNTLRLRQGFKDWDLDALFQRMTQTEELMTAKDWKFVQDVWDYLDTFRPESFKLQKDLTGREPERIMPTPLTTMHGVLKGGYYPATYDTDLNYTAFTREQKDLDKQLFGGRNYGAAMTQHSHLKERATTGAEQALSLDLGVITDHLYNTVHDLTHRKAVVEVAKLMRRPKVRKMVEDALSPEAYRQFIPWLQDVAQERQEPMNQLHRAARWARKGTTIMQMGLKFTTMITQPLGILQTLDVIGLKWAAVGLKHVYGNSYRIHKVYEEITTKSTFMNNRIKSFDREVRDAMKGLTTMDSFNRQVQEFAFKGIGYMQLGVDMPTWWGAYQRGLSESFGDEAKAVAYADSVVRISQGSGATKDLARVQRGGEYQRLATMFYSYFSALYSLTYRRVSKTKILSDIPTAAGSAIALWFLPAILSELIAGRGPDDDEEWPEWMAGLIATYPFLMFVGVKDIASAIESGFDYQLTPAASAPGALVKWARQVYKAWEEEDPERAVKPTVEAVGYVFHLPLKQPVITLGNIWDYMTGEDPEFEVRDLFFVKPKSRR